MLTPSRQLDFLWIAVFSECELSCLPALDWEGSERKGGRGGVVGRAGAVAAGAPGAPALLFPAPWPVGRHSITRPCLSVLPPVRGKDGRGHRLGCSVGWVSQQ